MSGMTSLPILAESQASFKAFHVMISIRHLINSRCLEEM